MIPSLRAPFNRNWSQAQYQRFLDYLHGQYGEPVAFRHSETPCFLPELLIEEAVRNGQELVAQLLDNPEYASAAQSAIPAAYRAPNEDAVPLFVQADFGLDAERNWKLVEIQGFPSLYGYQLTMADAYRDAYGLDPSLATLPGKLARPAYLQLFRNAVIGQHDPENVVLLEVDPWQQKTRHDFIETQRLLGISIVDARAVIKRGNCLFYSHEGMDVPIARIYNRVIADELQRRGICLPFDFRDDLKLEWAGHPNWFFRLSKFSLPYFQHPCAPQSIFFSDHPLPDDLHNWVLKPLYSFAGSGVIVGPNQSQIDAIPSAERNNYLLQRRVEFAPVIDTPQGPTKLELRVMYIWLDQMTPVNLIVRMGRGAQMGVDHNQGMGWVGASAAFIPNPSNLNSSIGV